MKTRESAKLWTEQQDTLILAFACNAQGKIQWRVLKERYAELFACHKPDALRERFVCLMSQLTEGDRFRTLKNRANRKK